MGSLDSYVNCFVFFFAGYLGIAEQAAWMICFDIFVLLCLSCVGLAKGSCTIVGQYIGSGQIEYAKDYYQTFNILGFI